MSETFGDDGTGDALREPSARLRASAQRHTSIIYFHGMGTPKRYEELSRVLDSLDRYATAVGDDTGIGSLRRQIVDLEPSRAGGDEPVTYIRFDRLVRGTDRSQQRVSEFRLYESYWSPAAAGGVSPPQVLFWTLRRILNPLAVLLRPWRAHQRLKLTFLSRMAFDRSSMPVARFRQLYTLYRSFEGMEQRRRHPSGLFAAFLHEIRAQTAEDPRARADLLRLARRWRWALLESQLWVLLIGISTLSVLLSLATLSLGVVVRALSLMSIEPSLISALTERTQMVPDWIFVTSALVLPLAYRQGRNFLRNFLSDVVFWTTTFEKDVHYKTRREILRGSEATLRHVLSDPRCERVVVVGHSLGTAIAYETLLNLGRRQRAERDVPASDAPTISTLSSKLSHFITFGSPIDRIAYFFNLTYSRYHRFNRVSDDLLGRTSDPPFRVQRVRALQWLNIRDVADPIASRLFSPRGRIPNREDIIEIEAASSHIPNPAGAHGGYFNSHLGAKLLFDACILDRKQVQAQTQRSRSSRLFALWSRRAAWTLALSAAASLTTGAVAFWTARPQLAERAQGGFLVCLVLIGMIWAAGWWMDRRERLSLPA